MLVIRKVGQYESLGEKSGQCSDSMIRSPLWLAETIPTKQDTGYNSIELHLAGQLLLQSNDQETEIYEELKFILLKALTSEGSKDTGSSEPSCSIYHSRGITQQDI
ncbi:hypothetical protein STEG23_021893 [Scotinomys teguina]